MLDYDDLAPRYVGICLICGEQVLKKKAVSIVYRAPYASVRTLGYFCRGCWIKFLEGNGISEP